MPSSHLESKDREALGLNERLVPFRLQHRWMLDGTMRLLIPIIDLLSTPGDYYHPAVGRFRSPVASVTTRGAINVSPVARMREEAFTRDADIPAE